MLAVHMNQPISGTSDTVVSSCYNKRLASSDEMSQAQLYITFLTFTVSRAVVITNCHMRQRKFGTPDLDG